MIKDFEQEITILEKICFSFDYTEVLGRDLHAMLVDTVCNALSALGYYFTLKKNIRFKSHSKKPMKGTIDILFFRGKRRIAVEIERASMIRLKNIAKLIDSGATLRICLLFPKRNSGKVDNAATKKRILEAKEKKNFTTPILVLNLKDRIGYVV